MKGFIKISVMNNGVIYEYTVHYTQLYFTSFDTVKWDNKTVRESYEEIKQLIKEATI